MSDSKSDELLAEARQVFVRSFASDFRLPVIASAYLKQGLLAATRQPGRYWVWRVAPPLTISHAEIDRSLEIIEAAIRTVVGG